MNYTVLIPALDPDDKLVKLVGELIENNIEHIIIIDDGSKNKTIFKKLADVKKITILQNAVNLGKGRSIKNGINYYLLNCTQESKGIITADADGQHLCEDIVKVGAKLCASSNFILGARAFSSKIPLRSQFGNVITKQIFHYLVGSNITDTQTGLRGIPKNILPELLGVSGEKYEYELNVLIKCKEKSITFEEVPISTIYINNNQSSHFNPLLDSMRIYFVFLRFISASLITAFLDFLCFFITYKLTSNILISFIISRLVAVVFNFLVNRNIVFKSQSNIASKLSKYLLFVFFIGTFSYFGVKQLVEIYNIDAIVAKIIVESTLFLVSFTIQRDYIFNKNERASSEI